MSTPELTLIAFAIALYVCFGKFLVCIWNHQLARALVNAGLGLIFLHSITLVLAWSSVAQTPSGMPESPWSRFSELQYNMPAIVGLVLIAGAGFWLGLAKMRVWLDERDVHEGQEDAGTRIFETPEPVTT